MDVTADCNINEKINADSAKLIPVLGKKILDCTEIEIFRYSQMSDLNFELADLGVTYENNAPICVDRIWYSYDNLGAVNNPIEGRLGCININLNGINGSSISGAEDQSQIFNDYVGSTKLSYCGCSGIISLNEPSLEFQISNLIINVQGTIGGKPFLGSYSYSGTLA